ncbi:hypothetical protein KI688_011839 [Linnemannia hyalina]|uniref:Uncharacterized protein n=1 Tax=Linnemannia hyalina TaxID=64524 RepID=A0A9P8BTH5_9FUNG|nr:hypothetical protein KI688_011839 [Linnemannia hyalina]
MSTALRLPFRKLAEVPNAGDDGHGPQHLLRQFRWGTTALINSLLTGAFSDVKIKRIGFPHIQTKDKCSLDGMVPGILRHARSTRGGILVSIATSSPTIIHNPTPPPSPQLDPSDMMFSKLMRSCPHLMFLSIPNYAARVESFERAEESGRVRIQKLSI